MESATLFQRLCAEPRSELLWRQLVDHYKEWVHGWAVKETRRHDVAQDIVQEVFLRMYKELDSLKQATPEGTSPRRWISTVTYHLIQDWRRDPRTRRCRLFSENGAEQEEAIRKKELQEAEEMAERLYARLDGLEEHLVLAERCERYALAWEALPARSEMTTTTVLSFLLRVRGQQASGAVAAQLGLPSPLAVNQNVRRMRLHFAEEVGLPRQSALLIDDLDTVARESAACAGRLERCARDYGYPPDA